jgi:hypothetical protein
MSINNSTIELIEDDRLTDLAGGRERFVAFPKGKIVCRGFVLRAAYSQATAWAPFQTPTCRPLSTPDFVEYAT